MNPRARFVSLPYVACVRGVCVIVFVLALGLLAALPTPASAQTALTLEEAMQRARASSPAARAAAAAAAEADERVREARSGFFPRVDVTESLQRGNQPVFVFSSLLSQRRFAEANFAIPELNHPDAVTNTRTAISLEQPVFDAGQTWLAVQAASIGRELAGAERDRAGHDLAVAAAQAYVRVLQLEAAVRASDAAVAAAGSDLRRARDRRDAGVVTEADVLALEVHLADMRQRQIAATGDLAVARIGLAEAVGLPLDEAVTLVRPVAPAAREAEADATPAFEARPERRQAELREQLADNARRAARASFLPRLGVQAGWEFDGATFAGQQSSWVAGVQLQLNLFRGFADSARLAAARHAQARAAAERERVERALDVEVRAARAQLAAARAREDAGRAALAQARESQRILRDRYDGGLATVTDVLRAAEAVLDAESRATAAELDVIVRGVTLDRALGRL